MKKHNIFLFIIFIFAVLAFSMKNGSLSNSRYKLVEIFEKPLQNSVNDSSINYYPINENLNYYKLTNTWSPGLQIPAPVLIAIDRDKNFYISNNSRSLIAYNSFGNFLFNIKFEEAFYGSYPILDNGNLYLYLSRWDQNTSKEEICKYNLQRKTEKKVSITDVKELNKYDFKYKVKEDFVNANKNSLNENIYSYKVIFDKNDKSIFKQSSGRYVSPENIIIYRFDSLSTNLDFSYGIPDQYKFDEIKVSELSNYKVVQLSSYKIDDADNIYISGIKSNEIEFVKSKENSNYKKDYVKIFNPIFFIWKLEKQN